LLDLFSGVGGFHKGFQQAGYQFDWVGFSEIDKYASAVYKHRFPKSEELGDITTIRPERDLPNNIDVLCGGFPCQSFSIAGKRDINDTRGTLFYEIARILSYYRDKGNPIPYFLLENVKGLYSHDNYATFARIYEVFTNLDYTIEIEMLNTRNFGIPQNRERIFFVGYLGDRGGSKIFPIGKNDKIHNNKSTRSKSKTKFAGAITTGEGSRRESNYVISKKENKLKQIGKINEGDSGKVYDIDGISCTLKSSGGGRGAKTGLYKISKSKVKVHTTHPRSGNPEQGGTGPLSRNDGNTYCIDTGNAQAVEIKSNIRRLTPTETCRLQGFTDDWNAYGNLDGKLVEMSDTQRYKQMGNAVTVKVIEVIADKMKVLFNE
tara:strand:+ start:7486 stop:8613 length:1128 start_codon:yes stop_codon:yes gene_type:complete